MGKPTIRLDAVCMGLNWAAQKCPIVLNRHFCPPSQEVRKGGLDSPPSVRLVSIFEPVYILKARPFSLTAQHICVHVRWALMYMIHAGDTGAIHSLVPAYIAHP